MVIPPSFYQHIPNPPGPTQWAHSQFSNNVYMYTTVPSSASFVNHLPSPVQKIRRYCTLGHNIITLLCRLSFLMHLHPGKGGRTGVEDVREHEMTESLSCPTLPLTTPRPPFSHGHLLFKPLLVVQFGPGVIRCHHTGYASHTMYVCMYMVPCATNGQSCDDVQHRASSTECYHFIVHYFMLLFYILVTVHSKYTVYMHTEYHN